MDRRVKYPQLQDAEWLTEHYIRRGRTYAEIAHEIGADRTTVRDAIRRHRLVARPRGRKPGQGRPRRAPWDEDSYSDVRMLNPYELREAGSRKYPWGSGGE
jgi:transposase-like protein